MKHRTKTQIAVLFTLTFIFTVGIRAEWTTDITNNTAVCTNESNQYLLAIASDTVGGVRFFYRNFIVGYETMEIMFQHINELGEPIFTNCGIRLNEESYVEKLIVLDSTSNYVDIAWIQDKTLKAQRISSAGDFLWSTNNSDVLSLPLAHSILNSVKTKDGYFIASLYETISTNMDIFHIAGQMLGFDGTLKWGEQGKVLVTNVSKDNITYQPFLCNIDITNVVLVWSDTIMEGYKLRGQKFSLSGAKLWSDSYIEIGPHIVDEEPLLVETVSDNSIIVLWKERHFGEDFAERLYVQKINTEGELLLSSNGVVIAEIVDDSTFMLGANVCAAVINESKQLFAFWYSFTNVAPYDLYVNYSYQIADTSNLFLWGPTNGMSFFPSLRQYVGRIACIKHPVGEGVITCWEYDEDIFYQIIDEEGTMLFSQYGMPVTVNSNSQDDIQIITMSDSIGVVAWNDMRNGNMDIYAQTIDIQIPEPATMLCILLIILMVIVRYKYKYYLFVNIILLFLLLPYSISAAIGPIFLEPQKDMRTHGAPYWGNIDNSHGSAFYFESSGSKIEVGNGANNWPKFFGIYYVKASGNNYIEFTEGKTEIGGR